MYLFSFGSEGKQGGKSECLTPYLVHKITQIQVAELLLFLAKNSGPGGEKAAISNRAVREPFKARLKP